MLELTSSNTLSNVLKSIVFHMFQKTFDRDESLVTNMGSLGVQKSRNVIGSGKRVRVSEEDS